MGDWSGWDWEGWQGLREYWPASSRWTWPLPVDNQQFLNLTGCERPPAAMPDEFQEYCPLLLAFKSEKDAASPFAEALRALCSRPRAAAALFQAFLTQFGQLLAILPALTSAVHGREQRDAVQIRSLDKGAEAVLLTALENLLREGHFSAEYYHVLADLLAKLHYFRRSQPWKLELLKFPERPVDDREAVARLTFNFQQLAAIKLELGDNIPDWLTDEAATAISQFWSGRMPETGAPQILTLSLPNLQLLRFVKAVQMRVAFEERAVASAGGDSGRRLQVLAWLWKRSRPDGNRSMHLQEAISLLGRHPSPPHLRALFALVFLTESVSLDFLCTICESITNAGSLMNILGSAL